jgi:hypothetical protein
MTDTRTADEKAKAAKILAEEKKRDRENLKRNLHPVFHEPLGLNEPEEEPEEE